MINRLARSCGRIHGLIGASVMTVALALLAPAAAFAEAGHPVNWQQGLQDSVTPVSDDIHAVYGLINVLIIIITVFVMALLLYVMMRFNEKSNPTPSRVTHNTMLEVAWTVIPVLILIVMFNAVILLGLPVQVQLILKGVIVIAASALYLSNGAERT